MSRKELDDAEALERSTAAQVSAARAQVETARINLGYANVTAPISGRAGQMRVLEGALVGQGEATLLTTIEQVDPDLRVLRPAGFRLRTAAARADRRRR